MRHATVLCITLLLLAVNPVLAQTTFIVNNTEDDGPGTLRQALIDATVNPGAGLIVFDIPGAGPHTIRPESTLPPLRRAIIVDGLSQQGADCSAWPPQLMIEIDGTDAGENADGLVLLGGSDGSVVRGLVINRFATNGAGIFIQNSNDHVLECDFLGTDVAGAADLGNTLGVLISNGTDNRVGGPEETQHNLISGNGNNVTLQNFNATDVTTGNRIEGNFIGTDVQGTAVLGSSGSNVVIVGASDNVIGGVAEGAGNVIAGGGGNGVFILGSAVGPATGNRVEGNRIGTDVTGAADLGNVNNGVQLFNASGNTIGGTAPGAGNVIAGNGAFGIEVFSNGDASADGNTIQGNFVGTDASGTAALPNDFDGIILRNSSENLVGGSEGAANLISGNAFHGVVVLNDEGAPAPRNNRIEGNRIGTDASGTQALGNGGVGVFLREGSRRTEVMDNVISANGDRGIFVAVGAPANTIQGNHIGVEGTGNAPLGNGLAGVSVLSDGNRIGGTRAARRNVIGANRFAGVEIFGVAAFGNRVEGNYIGVGADGVTVLGNTAADGIPGRGIVLSEGAAENTIGGEADGAGNRIAFNEGPGISIFGSETTENALLGNAIYRNDALGIDLGEDGVTDNGSANNGPNRLQNYPVITEALIGNSVRVGGTLNAAPAAPFRIEFFAGEACDDSGFGEGRQFLGFAEVATDASGEAAFSVTLDPTVALGTFMTATATDPDGNTSEFGACFEIVTGVAVENEAEAPTVFALEAAYPNPFNPTTTIRYALPTASEVKLAVYDVLGREVRVLLDGRQESGRHAVVWEAGGLPSGVYFYRLTASAFIQARRVTLIK